jgi:hypothetical protein
MKTLKQLAGEGARQAIFEDTDTRRQEIVLRFGGRESAVYTIEPDTTLCPAPAVNPAPAPAVVNNPVPQSQSQTRQYPPAPVPIVRTRTEAGLPYTEEQLNRLDDQWAATMERRRQQARTVQAIRRDRSHPDRETIPR